MNAAAQLESIHRAWLETLLPPPESYPKPVPPPPPMRIDVAVLSRWFAPEHLLHQDRTKAPIRGPAGIASAIASLRSMFGSFHVVIEIQGTEEPLTFTRFAMRARHIGRIGPVQPTGRWLLTTGMLMSRFEGNVAHESWLELDTLRPFAELGALEIVEEMQQRTGDGDGR